MKLSIAIFLCVLGSTISENWDSADDVTLPGDLLNKFNINASHIPTVEDGEKLLKEKCLKNGGDGVYENVLAARIEVQNCVKSLVNVTQLQDEIENAKPTGDLDLVFKKYCIKAPELEACITNFTATLEPCLEESEKATKKMFQNITSSVLQFMCYKGGDRIALFVSEKGPECLTSKQEDIEDCINSTLSKHIPKDALTLQSLPLLVLGKEECRDVHQLQTCVHKKLLECSEPTPANIVDSMFNFIKKMTPCTNYRFSEDDPENNSASSSIVGTFLSSLLLIFVVVHIQ